MEKYVKYYDIEGNPITPEQWSEYHRNDQYRRIADELVGKFQISTVWLGIDHGFGFEGQPIEIFETMVFNSSKEGDEAWYDLDMERYSTLEGAKMGHQAMVETYKNLISSSSMTSQEELTPESQETC